MTYAARVAGACATLGLVLMVSFGATLGLAQDYAAIIALPDRAEADRTTDKRRDPVSLLSFTGPKTGWTVLDMGAGAGYSTELMARSVGPAARSTRRTPSLGEADGAHGDARHGERDGSRAALRRSASRRT